MIQKPFLPPARTWWSFFFCLVLTTPFSRAQPQGVTNGPLAPQSLSNEMAYKTGRSCAVGCLVYNGGIPCNAGGFYQDLGVWLGCSQCGQINACYCSADLASSATSLIDSCVSSRCSQAGVADWDMEVTKMLGLYDGYCATANIAPPTTSRVRPQATAKVSGAVKTDNATPGAGAGTNTDGQTPQETTPTTPTTTEETSEKKGLSQSDIVALAASLGVGIPSLLIAAITLCVQVKKRKKRNHQKLIDDSASGTLVGGSIPAASVVHPLSPQTPYRSHTTTPVLQQGHQGFAVPGSAYAYPGQPGTGPYGGAPEILLGHGEGIPLQQRVLRY